MSKDRTLTFNAVGLAAEVVEVGVALKRFRRELQRIERRVKRFGNGPAPAPGWRHRKGQARR